MSTPIEQPIILQLPSLPQCHDVCDDTTPSSSLETERSSFIASSTPPSSLTSGLDLDPGPKDVGLIRRCSYRSINPYLEISSSASAPATHFLGPPSVVPTSDLVKLKIHVQDKRTRLIHPVDADLESAMYTVILQKSKFGRQPHVQVYHHLKHETTPLHKRLVGTVHIHHRVRNRVDWEVHGLRSSMQTLRKTSIAHLNTKHLMDEEGRLYHDQEMLIQVPVMGSLTQQGEVLCIPKILVSRHEDLTRLVTVAMALSLRNEIILRRAAKMYKYDPLAALCPALGPLGTSTTGVILTANLGGIGA